MFGKDEQMRRWGTKRESNTFSRLLQSSSHDTIQEMSPLSKEQRNSLLYAALEAKEKAYAPYRSVTARDLHLSLSLLSCAS